MKRELPPLVCEAETRGKKFAESGNEDFEPEMWVETSFKNDACFEPPDACLNQRINCNRCVLSASAQHRIGGREQQCGSQCQRRRPLCFVLLLET
jgi:hypothetical protein